MKLENDDPCGLMKHIKLKERLMSHFDLSDELRALERLGVQVPVLNFSNNLPTYSETTPDGADIYEPGHIRVPRGHVIDSHGNVVNLQELREQASSLIRGSLKIVPSDAWPQKYDSKGLRVSPDIQRVCENDVWYSKGFRDETRSPKDFIDYFK